MDAAKIDQIADALYRALRDRQAISPLTEGPSGLSLDDAYQVSRALLERREADGERVIGKKIGVTSHAVQRMLNVHQPDFGFLTDAMQFENGGEMPIGEGLIQPRAEGEIAFILGQDLVGPGITIADVLSATSQVAACFEVVDSRIEDWKIGIQDTVADNASCGYFVVGDAVSPDGLDLVTTGMVVRKNGALLSTGAGAACMGSPLNAVAWLANTLGRYGIPLRAGEIILSGSLVPLEPVVPGDEMTLAVGGIGCASVRFV